MFGIIMAVYTLASQVVDSVHKVVQNEQGYKRGLERKQNGTDNTNTYFDWRGERRDLDTREIRKVDFAIVEDYGQDRCIRDRNNKVVRNLTEEEAEKRRRFAISKGETVYLYRAYGNGIYNGKEHRDKGGNGWCDGSQYKNINTGEIYVTRRYIVENVGLVEFYMSLEGKLVRPTVLWYGNDREEINRFKKTFNLKQEQNKPEILKRGYFKNPNCIEIHELNEYYNNRFATNG